MKTLDVAYRNQDQLKVDQTLYVHLVDISKIPILTMRQSSVTYQSNNFTLKGIQEHVGCVQNPTLNRALEVETGKVRLNTAGSGPTSWTVLKIIERTN